MPSTICEPIECLSKVLDGTHVACGLGIGRGLDVMFSISFSITIMCLVFSFKSWKLNNDVFTSFYAISRIWSWHSISWSMKSCVFSWCTCTLGTWEFVALAACGVIVSSPLANKVRSFFVLRGWKNYDMTVWALALVIALEPDANPSVWITYLMAETLVMTFFILHIKIL